MTDTVPAAATGLPAASSFDRRSFLATLAAAGVLTGAALPVEAADHPDAGLFALVSALFAAEAHWKVMDARADADAIFDRCEALMPTVPPALFFQEGRDTFEICYDRKRLSWIDGDSEGERRWHYAEERHVPALRWKIAQWHKHGTGRDVVDRAEEIIAALDPYAAAVKRAEEESGVTAFLKETSRNQTLIDDLNKRIAGTSANTAVGVAAKARAAAVAWSSDERWLETDLLPRLLAGETSSFGDRPEILLAVSLIVDAVKLPVAA